MSSVYFVLVIDDVLRHVVICQSTDFSFRSAFLFLFSCVFTLLLINSFTYLLITCDISEI